MKSSLMRHSCSVSGATSSSARARHPVGKVGCKKVWAFGPTQAIVKQYLATFKQWPPVSRASNKAQLERSLVNIESHRRRRP
jgi:hypothetical protein